MAEDVNIAHSCNLMQYDINRFNDSSICTLILKCNHVSPIWILGSLEAQATKNMISYNWHLEVASSIRFSQDSFNDATFSERTWCSTAESF